MENLNNEVNVTEEVTNVETTTEPGVPVVEPKSEDLNFGTLDMGKAILTGGVLMGGTYLVGKAVAKAGDYVGKKAVEFGKSIPDRWKKVKAKRAERKAEREQKKEEKKEKKKSKKGKEEE